MLRFFFRFPATSFGSVSSGTCRSGSASPLPLALALRALLPSPTRTLVEGIIAMSRCLCPAPSRAKGWCRPPFGIRRPGTEVPGPPRAFYARLIPVFSMSHALCARRHPWPFDWQLSQGFRTRPLFFILEKSNSKEFAASPGLLPWSPEMLD